MVDELFYYLEEVVGLSNESLDMVTGIYGFTEDTLESVLFYYTGYRSLEQALESEEA